MPSEVPQDVGLCGACRHARVVVTTRSQFWLCGRSRFDATFERYPRLPVLACPGFERGAADSPGPAAEPDESAPQK